MACPNGDRDSDEVFLKGEVMREDGVAKFRIRQEFVLDTVGLKAEELIEHIRQPVVSGVAAAVQDRAQGGRTSAVPGLQGSEGGSARQSEC
mmetsp:Transcript_102483/g.319309  ORF Transcript_102483/g.319309 Transcript_102483/m.319309 type:complete len:91 (+) Transcript_102483:639-911(+)